MKNTEILKNDINILNLDYSLVIKLRSLNINKIEDLWIKKREYFKSNGFNNIEISEIKIKLQLIGLDLNKKIY